jgi:hypothetical protein
MPEVLEVALFGRALHVTLRDPGAAESLRARLLAEKVELSGVRRIPPALEDVFVARVREAGGAVLD